MPVVLNDEEITKLITEPKILPQNYQELIKLKSKRGHKEAELDLDGTDGSKFRLILRQSSFDPFDFSVILAYHIPKTNVLFRLKRYNGKSHEHTNKIEGETFYGFHIHHATERYQQMGLREDEYATSANQYADLYGALQSALKECEFVMPPNTQLELALGL